MLVKQNKKWKGVLTASGITFKNKQIVIQTGIVHGTLVIVKKRKGMLTAISLTATKYRNS